MEVYKTFLLKRHLHNLVVVASLLTCVIACASYHVCNVHVLWNLIPAELWKNGPQKATGVGGREEIVRGVLCITCRYANKCEALIRCTCIRMTAENSQSTS